MFSALFYLKRKYFHGDTVLSKLEEDLRNFNLSSLKHLVWYTATRPGSVSFSYKGTLLLKFHVPVMLVQLILGSDSAFGKHVFFLKKLRCLRLRIYTGLRSWV